MTLILIDDAVPAYLVARVPEGDATGAHAAGDRGTDCGLLPVVRRHYYHRAMRGSWSIKAVLPTIASELGYDSLSEVHSGTDAQVGYLEATNPETSDERRQALRRTLLDYCRRDTQAMVVVLERLSA